MSAPPADPGLRIWLDADAAPRDVKDIVARAALRLEIPTLFVSNQRLQTPANNPFVSAVRVADAAIIVVRMDHSPLRAAAAGAAARGARWATPVTRR